VEESTQDSTRISRVSNRCAKQCLYKANASKSPILQWVRVLLSDCYSKSATGQIFNGGEITTGAFPHPSLRVLVNSITLLQPYYEILRFRPMFVAFLGSRVPKDHGLPKVERKML